MLIFKLTDDFSAIDNLLQEYSGEEAFQLINNIYGSNLTAPVLVRLSNATYIRANCEENHAKRKELLRDGRQYALDALKLEPENETVFKWCATLTGVLAEHSESMSERIKLGQEFKLYLDRALEIDKGRNYPELFHMAGRFAYQVASIGLIERGLATIFFGKIPHSSYEDALAYFLQSEEKTPGELENTLFIAKCYEKLGDVPKAIEYLKKLVGTEPIDAIDSEHIGDALNLLMKLDPDFVTRKTDSE